MANLVAIREQQDVFFPWDTFHNGLSRGAMQCQLNQILNVLHVESCEFGLES